MPSTRTYLPYSESPEPVHPFKRHPQLPFAISASGKVLRWRNSRWREAGMYPNRNGYLSTAIPGGKKMLLIHRLVLETFQGPAPDKKSVGRHLNGNRTDNRADNLQWGSVADNVRDALRHGTHVRGERQHLAALTEAKVLEIRMDLQAGIKTKAAIAREHGVCRSTICHLASGKTWKHLPKTIS